MFGRVSAFLNMVRCTLPALLGEFESMVATSQRADEDEALRRLYVYAPGRQLAATSRERPLLRILLTKVVLFTPRRTAAPDAPPTTQLVVCSALRM